MKGILKDMNKWKDILCSRTGRINIGKMYKLPKALNKFNTIPIRSPMAFSPEIESQF